MLKCPSCAREIPPDSRLCPYCGSAIEPGAGIPTVTAPPRAAAPAEHRPTASPSSIDDTRFTPGTMLTERVAQFPVVKEGKLIGFLSRTDLIRKLLHQSI